MKILIIIVFITLIFQNSNAITVINEIMYNPEGGDNEKEFIEIYSTDYRNLTGFGIEDLSGKDEDNLTLLQFFSSNYFLIVENGFNYANIDATIYSAGNQIGNNLNNDNDIIILRDDKNKIIDVVSYSSDFGGDNNGKSLERISINGYSNDLSNWKESNLNGGSPGTNNSVIEININDIIINEFLPDPVGNDDANMPEGEWVELYNNKDYDINLEGFYLEDDFGHKLAISNTNTNSLTIKRKSYSVIYLNSVSGFLNNDLDKIKLLYGNKVIDKVSYSNSKEGFSWGKINKDWKILTPSPEKENIDDSESRTISSISIEKVYSGSDNSLRFGDIFEVRLEIYKGDTNKNAINVQVKKDDKRISKVTNFNVYKKFVNYTINIPLILDANCNNKYEDGVYEIIAEGLDEEDKEEIKVEGIDKSLCNIKEIKVKEFERESSGDFSATPNTERDNEDMSELVIKDENKIQGEVIYESSDIKAKNLSNYILIITLVLIMIVILFRKGL